MTNVSFRITSSPDWGEHMTQATLGTERLIERAAFELERRAKRKAPVDTGRLRSSITTAQESPESWLVGTNVRYAPDQEFGTSRHAAQPYLRPAADEVRRILRDLADGNVLSVRRV